MALTRETGVLAALRTSAVLRGAVAAIAVVNAVAASVGLVLLPLAAGWGRTRGQPSGSPPAPSGFGALGGPVLGRLGDRWRSGRPCLAGRARRCVAAVAPAPTLWVAVPLLVDRRRVRRPAGDRGHRPRAARGARPAAGERARADRHRDGGRRAARRAGRADLGGVVGPVRSWCWRRGREPGRRAARTPSGRGSRRAGRGTSAVRWPDQYSGGVDFWSSYAHGFVRVAACTVPVAIADPARNAEIVLEQARECHDESVALAVFPELILCGYSIDDLLMQDTLLDGVLAAIDTIVEGSTDLLPVIVVGAPLVHGTRVLNCAVVIHRGRVLGVAPKSYLPTYREFYERRWFAPGDDRRGGTIRLGGHDVPFGPDLIFRATDLRGLRAVRRGVRGHVGAGAAERRGLAGRRHRDGEPLGQPDHRGPCRGPSAAGPLGQRPLQRGVPLRGRGPGRVDDRPVLGRPDDGLRVRRAAGRERALPRRPAPVGGRRRPRPHPPGADPPGHPRRQPAHAGRPDRGVPHRRVRAGRAHRRPRAAPQGRPLPVRARRRRAAGARLLRGLQHPGLRARAAAARHRRQRQGGHRRQRRPRLDPRR